MFKQLLYVKDAGKFFGLVACGYFILLFASDLYYMDLYKNSTIGTVFVSSLVSFLLPVLMMPFVIKASLRFPLFIKTSNSIKHIGICLLYVVTFVFLAQFIRMAIDGHLLFNESWEYIKNSLSRQFLFSGSMAFLSYWGIVVLSGLQVYYSELIEVRNKTNQLNEQLSIATLSTLKAQLKPHFLFNTLNMVDFLIHTNHEKAVETITKLEDLIKSTFDKHVPQHCTVSDEITFLKKYLDIEKARFQDRLEINFEIDPSTEFIHIPCYLVQPLVENSIKHAVGNMLTTCTLHIVAGFIDNNLLISVRDNGQNELCKNNELTWGVGLKNIDERLKLFFGPEAKLEISHLNGEGFQSEIIIPKKYVQYD